MRFHEVEVDDEVFQFVKGRAEPSRSRPKNQIFHLRGFFRRLLFFWFRFHFFLING